ncbi:MAG: NAD-binding protein, partial [Bacteroidota bacterium]
GLELASRGVPGAEYITPLVFMIVLGTVVINATTAKIIARLLGVIQDGSRGILIVGANSVSELLAKYLNKNNRHVVVIDNNPKNIENFNKMGLNAMQANVFQDDLNDQIDLVDIGYLMAVTSSQEVNNFAVKKYKRVFGEEGAYRLLGTSETRLATAALPQNGIFSYQNDFLQLASIVKDYPNMQEVAVTDIDHLKNLMAAMANDKKRAPIFLKEHQDIHVLPADLETIELEEEGAILVYMGAELEAETAKKLATVEIDE